VFSKNDAEDLCKRYKALKAKRQLEEPLWQEIADYFLPQSSSITVLRSPGAKRTEKLFDSTAIDAAQRLASNFQGAMTNPALPWFSMEFDNRTLKESQAAQQWLEDVSHEMLRAYASSNAYQAFHELYVSLVVFATGCLLVEENDTTEAGFNGFNFTVLPMGSFVIEEDHRGVVDTVMRQVSLSARQAAQQFGVDHLCEKARDMLRDPRKQDEPRTYVHAVYPRADAQYTHRAHVRPNTKMPYASIYLDLDEAHVVKESGYEEFPYFVPRWAKVPESPWGFGPGHIALPDVKSLNLVMEWGLKSLPLHLQPPIVTDDDSVIGRFDFTPAGINVVRPGARFEWFQAGGRPDVVQFKTEELRTAIRRMFFIDQLSAVPNDRRMTAFEVAERVQEMQQIMGPTFSRLTSELFDPLADRCFGLMYRDGALPEPPPEVVQEATQNRGRMRVTYQGPLARAQRVGDVQAIQNFYMLGAQMVQSTGDPSIFDSVDHDGMLRHVADVSGVPKQGLRDKRQVAQMRQAKAQQMQEMQEAQSQVAASEAAKNVTPLLREVREGTQAMTGGERVVV
jgi:hypothetical protein